MKSRQRLSLSKLKTLQSATAFAIALQFCARYGLNLQNYQHALKIDDLHVKAIYEFAKETGTEVQWDLYPLD